MGEVDALPDNMRKVAGGSLGGTGHCTLLKTGPTGLRSLSPTRSVTTASSPTRGIGLRRTVGGAISLGRLLAAGELADVCFPTWVPDGLAIHNAKERLDRIEGIIEFVWSLAPVAQKITGSAPNGYGFT